ncbi:MAG: ABC transporter permease [bacterium]|nr:MAG: ABC transporter permease [bacterium]
MLQLKNVLKTAFKSIFKNRMRSLLTSLGIIIGVSAVIVMVSIGEGSQKQIEEGIQSLGTNLIVVFPGASRSGGVSRGAGSFNRFTFEDVEKIDREAALISAVSPVVRTGGQIIGGGKNWFTTVFGVSPAYFEIRNWELQDGEFFSERDLRAKKKVALLGKTITDELFAEQDPIGEKIRIRSVPFTVIGVLKSKGQSGMGNDQDDVILAPATTVFYRLKGGRHVDMINASALSVERIDAAQEEMRAILREAHRLSPGDDDDFTISNQAEISDAASETSRIMTLLLGSIAGVSLVVGGIGIMNIMLVSVTERTREIGIRLSVGARSIDVLIQFLTEAVILSLSGGVLGILLSFIISIILNRFTELVAVVNPQIIIVSTLFSAAVGIFFGFYPARKASLLNPIDALRYE